MKNKFILLIAIIASIPIYIPIVNYQYKLHVHEKEYSLYSAEKKIFDEAELKIENQRKDSLFNDWINKNDTSLAVLERIAKVPHYAKSGYYKNNGDYTCEKEDYSDRLRCTPDKDFIVTRTYIDYYQEKPVYSKGYKNRNEWIKIANDYASKEAASNKKQFVEFNGEKRPSEELIGNICVTFLVLSYILIFVRAFFDETIKRFIWLRIIFRIIFTNAVILIFYGSIVL